jgi:hypothetical protein
MTQDPRAAAIAAIIDESVKKVLEAAEMTAFAPGYDCTGNSFGCDSYYICDNNNHNCKTDTSFSCGGDFSCTGGAFGIVLEARATTATRTRRT